MRAIKIVCFVLCACLPHVAIYAAEPQYKILYAFGSAGPADGALPEGKLLMDKAGNLYGTTSGGGKSGNGTVFELSPTMDGGWQESVLYEFCSLEHCADGAIPVAGLVFDQSGNLYGTTMQGGYTGNSCCLGAVFKLSPPSVPGESWIETVLWTFSSMPGDGVYPRGKLVFDAAGNLYGTTSAGGSGSNAAGTVFELTASGDGSWKETILYTFDCLRSNGGCLSGSQPYAGVTFDKVGNLYGTTWQGGGQGEGGGVVYRLSPGQKGWTQSVLFDFTTPGSLHGVNPMSAVNFDSVGNLFGTVSGGGRFNLGGVFRLSPTKKTEYTLSLSGTLSRPMAGVLIDPRNGNLYGTAYGTGVDHGSIFKVVGKKITSLHDFAGGADGERPVAALIADKKGHLYGTTKLGGDFNKGVVFEILP